MAIAETQGQRPALRVRRPHPRTWVDAATLTAACAFYATYIAHSGFSVAGRTYFVLHDDAMIAMRYARNLVEGHGLTWSGGQHVEGYTNFLWTMWMAFVHLLPLSPSTISLAVMATGAVLLLATMVVVRAICARLAGDRPIVGTVAMALTGFFYPLLYWALPGMEVGLAALLIAVMALLALSPERLADGRARWALAAVMAMAVLTRDDLLLPCLVVGAYAVRAAEPSLRRRLAITLGGALIATVGGHTAFRLAYYGDALPNTYYLKLARIALVDRLERGGIALAFTWLYSLYIPLLLAGTYLLARRRSLPRGVPLLVALVLVQSAYSLYVGGDAWEHLAFANRYVSSTAPMLMVLAALGIAELATPRGRRLAPWLAGVCALMAIVVAHYWLPVERVQFLPYPGLRTGSIAVAALGAAVFLGVWRARVGPVAVMVALAALALVQVDREPVRDWAHHNIPGWKLNAYWTRMGVVLRDTTSPRTTVAVIGAGNTPYFAERPAVDILGKMDPVIAHGPMRRGHTPQTRNFWPGHSKWNYGHSIGRLRPDVVTLLWEATPAELCRMRAWGYRPVGGEVFVRDGARGVRAGELARRVYVLRHGIPWFRFPPRCPASA